MSDPRELDDAVTVGARALYVFTVSGTPDDFVLVFPDCRVPPERVARAVIQAGIDAGKLMLSEDHVTRMGDSWNAMSAAVAAGPQARADAAETRVAELLALLRKVLPTNPATATYQEETWCYWCHSEDTGWGGRGGMTTVIKRHEPNCAWVTARAVLAGSGDTT